MLGKTKFASCIPRPKTAGGISACEYNTETQNFLIRGWFVGANVKEISIFVAGKLLGLAKYGIERTDIGKQYPGCNRSGFELRCKCEIPQNSKVIVDICYRDNFGILTKKFSKTRDVVYLPHKFIRHGGIWNLPVEEVKNKNEMIENLLRELIEDRRVKVLEIGVYRAATIKRFFNAVDESQIVKYIGVDPYLGDDGDPYTGSYWSSKNDADSFYQEAKAVFEKYNKTLMRTTSNSFFRSNNEKFDIIFIDGDHSYKQALNDLIHSFECIENDGIILVDDYANPLTPEVTKALTAFIHNYGKYIENMGRIIIEFIKPGMLYIPASLTQVYMKIKKS